MTKGWRPALDVRWLRERARLLSGLRTFFAEREVLEVDTPVLVDTVIPERHIEHIRAGGSFLQASPEWAMKRLLAAGSGPIYQITRAFRAEEHGRWHQPEFALLEWYRPGWDHHALMDETAALLEAVGVRRAVTRVAYGELFEEFVGLDPHAASGSELRAAAISRGLEVDGIRDDDPATWLDLLFSFCVQPAMPTGPVLIHAYPASQAALARLAPSDPPVAERFELFLDRLEVANGFHELTDAAEQRRRFEADCAARARDGRTTPPMDEGLLAALECMPPSAGAALGVDRLMAGLAGAPRLAGIMPFPR